MNEEIIATAAFLYAAGQGANLAFDFARNMRAKQLRDLGTRREQDITNHGTEDLEGSVREIVELKSKKGDSLMHLGLAAIGTLLGIDYVIGPQITGGQPLHEAAGIDYGSGIAKGAVHATCFVAAEVQMIYHGLRNFYVEIISQDPNF